MYTITEERADELMLMELTVRREMETILASRSDDEMSWERVRLMDELIDTQMDEGVVATYLKMRDLSARYRERGDRKGLSLALTIKTHEVVADALCRGIER